MTLKAMRALGEADVIAHFAKAGQRQPFARHRRAASARRGHRAAAALSGHDRAADVQRPAIATPSAISTTTPPPTIAAHLEAGRVVAVICEGDPLFYGSYMHLHARLAPRFPTEIVAGVTGMSGCWSAAGMPIAQGDDVFTVLPATLPEGELARRLAEADAAVVMKVGRHLPKLRRALGPKRPAAARHLCRARHHGGCEDDPAQPPSPTTTRRISPWCWCRAGRSGRERASRRRRIGAGRCRAI